MTMSSCVTIKRVTAVLGLVLSTGCYEDESVRVQGMGQSAPMSFEEFRASAERLGDGYVVDGDIFLNSEDKLREFYYSYPGEGALTVNQTFSGDDLWAFPSRYGLTYCVSNDFAANKARLVQELEIAARSWSDLVGVRYQYLSAEDGDCDASNNDVGFHVVPRPGSTSSAFFPSYPRADRSFRVADTAFTTTEGGRDLQGILRHELGHTLGFRHEHIWLNDRGCSDETTLNSRLVNSYDVDSVMHYPQCRPINAGGYRQTTLDYAGAISLYGLSPQLILSSQLVVAEL
jgi:serralysin